MAEQNFQHWTPITLECYKRNMVCEGCPNNTDYLCNKPVWNNNPYRIKNIKYAVMRIIANIGEPE